MAMASWMLRGRSSRTGRALRSRHDSEDDVQIDPTKDSAENAKEILLNISRKQGLTVGRRFGYLNAFVKLTKAKGIEELGYSVEQLLCCLRVALAHDATQVRAAALRAVRYLLKEEEDVKTLHSYQYSYLIARSFDINLHNDVERMQALRLIRRMLVLAPSTFPPALVRSLVSLGNGAGEEKDRMLQVCLAALAEICVLNTEVFINSGGVTAVQRNLLECSMPRIAESLCGVLLFLLNNPVTRAKARVQLQSLAAPFCDIHWDPSKNREEREARFHCSRLALLSVLRSWPGVLHFCHPGDRSGLRSIVDILYVRHLEIRKAILDLLYELLGLPLPEWTDEFSVALEAVDPSYPRETWKISDGFVAAEGHSILPHLGKCRPNLVEMHLTLLLFTFLEVGLLDAIAEVVVTADTFISVRATILLGELLHLIHILLPPECCNLTPPLPILLEKVACGDPYAQTQALAAVAALARLHGLLKRQPMPASLFLDNIMQGGAWGVKAKRGGLPPVTLTDDMGLLGAAGSRSKREKSKLYQLVLKDSDDIFRDSMVLSNKDGFSWNWTIVRSILKSRGDALRKLEDSNYKTFMRRLVQYYKPSSNRFCRVEVSSKQPMNIYTLAGFEFLDCLLESDEQTEGQKLLSEFLADLWVQLDAVTSSSSAHACLFSPSHLAHTLSQDYFLFIGRLSRTARGIRVLDKAGILQQLLNLVVATSLDIYTKLVVAGLDYSLDAMPRVILSKALTAGVDSSRLYATRHMLVLLRSRLPDFHKWGVELLVMQLYDPNTTVSAAALNILAEAVEDKGCLEVLVGMRPSLLHLGDRGLLLLICFLSTPQGFSCLRDAGFVTSQLKHWATTFNCRYVQLVEGELHDSLTLHQRGEDGRYSQRVTSARHYVKDVLVPPHLYGQLVQHEGGVNVLKEDSHLPKIIQVVREGQWEGEVAILELKAALWALGHMGTSDKGVALLDQADVAGFMVQLAEGCAEYAVRATAFYVLGLLATTIAGTAVLNKLGWLAVRHNRHEQWPVIEEAPEIEDSGLSCALETDDSVSLSSGGGLGPSSELWDLEPGGESAQGRSFYLAGDEESGNEDEGAHLDESQWTSELPSSKTGGLSIPASRLAQAQRKSATLPHSRPGLPPVRHIRSLSESKQVPPRIIVGPDTQSAGDWMPPQVIRARALEPVTVIAGNTLTPKASEDIKSRSNSCTDSSGVSSCESGPGRHHLPERVQPTLSPIPSSASLHTLQSSGVRRASQISQRKLSSSNQGSVTSEHSSPSETFLGTGSVSRMSHQDLIGYATLRALNRHRRPLLSDSFSAKGEGAFGFDDAFPLSGSLTAPGSGSPSAASRVLKARSLDRHFSHPALGELEGSLRGSFSDASALERIGYPSSRLSTPGLRRCEPGRPCYLGICLPRQLMALYPRLPGQGPVPGQAAGRRRGSTSFSELEQLPEAGLEIEPSSSSSSDDEEPVAAGTDKDDWPPDQTQCTSVCMLCCRAERNRKISTSSLHRHRTDTESSQGGMDSPVLGPPRRHKSHSFSSGGAEALPANTPSEDAGSISSPSVSGALAEDTHHHLSRRFWRRDILKHVARMSNPVWAKLSKQALLQMKQRYPNAFQDVCLYSAVGQKLASRSYRMVARRFIQELFLDLNFDVFYEEANKILQNQQVTTVSAVVPQPSTSAFICASPKTSVTVLPAVEEDIVAHAPSITLSALSMKLAGAVASPPGRSSEPSVKEIPAGSPLETAVINGTKSIPDGSSGSGRPSGSDPVPIAAPSKNVSLPPAYMMRSPPLEVVKEEPTVSVSSSEPQSPVDTSSIISNGQAEEENVAFLNQKFDDIPMIDEGNSNQTSVRKHSNGGTEVKGNCTVIASVASQKKTEKLKSAAKPEAKNDTLVDKDKSNILISVLHSKAGPCGDVDLLKTKSRQGSVSHVPHDSPAESSTSSGLRKPQGNSVSSSACTASSRRASQGNVSSKSAMSNTPFSKSSRLSDSVESRCHSKSPSSCRRQRKLATSVAPNVKTLQDASSSNSAARPNVPSTSKQRR